MGRWPLDFEDRFESTIASGNWERVEELWLDALERTPTPTAFLLDVVARLGEHNRKELARTLLDLLAESLESAADHENAFAALREMMHLAKGKSPELRQRLEQGFANARADSPSLNRVLEHFALRDARHPLRELELMESWLDHDVGTVVEVVGQGVGRVVDLNLELGNVKVDIVGRRPVSVPFGAVSRFLRRLPEGDFLRLKVEEPEKLRDLVNGDPGEALVQILESLDKLSDVSAIKAALDGLLPASRWNTWWAKARRHPRVLSSGSGSRLRYEVSRSAEAATQTLLRELEEAEPRSQLAVARRLSARGEEAARTTACFLAETLPDLEGSDPGLAWETAALLVSLPGGSTPADASQHRLMESVDSLRLLAGISDRGERTEVLKRVRADRPDAWTSTWGTWFLQEEQPAVLDLLASTLVEAGATETLEDAVESVFRSLSDHPAQIVWACERMTEDGSPEVLRRHMTPSLLEIIPDLITRKEFASLRTRSKALLDGGRVAIRLLLEKASPQHATRFEQRIARLSGIELQRLRLVQQAAQQCQGDRTEPKHPALVATRSAVEGKRNELRQLLEVEIPKTLKGINAAAAEGDLRENFEYHMLRDRQELQSARAAKIQRELAEVRILEPGSPDTSRVNIGTVVHFEGVGGETVEPITILGAWDADIERRMFANGSDLAQGLLGRKVGDEVEAVGKPVRNVAIEAWAPEEG